mmetsp:Transcript_56728/g.106505  ORF Transcript_56728/g.106505 Transcript_56728/m.106505 type:complete len:226 (+) Transcript_56728:580-1257(+)
MEDSGFLATKDWSSTTSTASTRFASSSGSTWLEPPRQGRPSPGKPPETRGPLVASKSSTVWAAVAVAAAASSPPAPAAATTPPVPVGCCCCSGVACCCPHCCCCCPHCCCCCCCCFTSLSPTMSSFSSQSRRTWLSSHDTGSWPSHTYCHDDEPNNTVRRRNPLGRAASVASLSETAASEAAAAAPPASAAAAAFSFASPNSRSSRCSCARNRSLDELKPCSCFA